MQINDETLVRLNGQDLAEKEAAEAAAKKNYNFVQVKKSSFKELQRLAEQSPKALKLMFILVEKMNRENALMVSRATLQKLSGMSQATLTRAISTLKEERWIQIIKVGTNNVYRINSEVFWQNKGDMRFTSFRATIIASEDEQDKNDLQVKLKHFPFLEAEDTNRLTIDNEELPPPDQGELNV